MARNGLKSRKKGVVLESEEKNAGREKTRDKKNIQTGIQTVR